MINTTKIAAYNRLLDSLLGKNMGFKMQVLGQYNNSYTTCYFNTVDMNLTEELDYKIKFFYGEEGVKSGLELSTVLLDTECPERKSAQFMDKLCSLNKKLNIGEITIDKDKVVFSISLAKEQIICYEKYMLKGPGLEALLKVFLWELNSIDKNIKLLRRIFKSNILLLRTIKLDL